MEYRVEDCTKKSVYTDLLMIANSVRDSSMLKNRTVMITGAAGFIGYYLCASLLLINDLYSDGIKVLALVRNKEKAERKFGDLIMRNDIELCIQDVTEKIIAVPADYVIHAASQASNIQFETDPVGTINANLLGTANVLNYAKESNSVSTLIVSSLKIYGTMPASDLSSSKY